MDEHKPVLVDEAAAALAIDQAEPEALFVDATFGRGGHAARLLAQLGPQARLLALDRDATAVAAAQTRFAGEPRLVVVHRRYSQIREVVRAFGEGRPCRGVLFDFGVSSPQLDDPGRGFSFQHDGPLDMRMDQDAGQSAADWLAQIDPEELRDVIGTLGEERFAGRVARAIVAARQVEPITRTAQLAAIVARAVPTREGGKHPATRSFQAIRMAVNDELAEIETALSATLEVLAPQGRLAAISFHSLEDRRVKQFIQRESQPDPAWARLPIAPAFEPRLRRIGRKQKASEAEVATNPRARSAILRVAERT